MQKTSGQRTPAAAGALGKNETKTTSKIITLIGALTMAGTYAWTILSHQGNLEASATSPALPLVLGYLASALLILFGNAKSLPLSIIALIPFASALNIVTGEIVGRSPLPLYLDSIATIFVGYLAGPAAGALTGIITNLAWGLLINPSTIPYAAGAALIGALAGFAGRLKLFSRLWKALLAGFGTGIIAGMVAAPISAFVYGGGLGVGTGSLVATLQATGQSMLQAVTLQSLASDPLDKALAFLLVFFIAASLPRRVKSRFTA